MAIEHCFCIIHILHELRGKLIVEKIRFIRYGSSYADQYFPCFPGHDAIPRHLQFPCMIVPGVK